MEALLKLAINTPLPDDGDEFSEAPKVATTPKLEIKKTTPYKLPNHLMETTPGEISPYKRLYKVDFVDPDGIYGLQPETRYGHINDYISDKPNNRYNLPEFEYENIEQYDAEDCGITNIPRTNAFYYQNYLIPNRRRPTTVQGKFKTIMQTIGLGNGLTAFLLPFRKNDIARGNHIYGFIYRGGERITIVKGLKSKHTFEFYIRVYLQGKDTHMGRCELEKLSRSVFNKLDNMQICDTSEIVI